VDVIISTHLPPIPIHSTHTRHLHVDGRDQMPFDDHGTKFVSRCRLCRQGTC